MINYINGDEALFEDASLPRDSFGFKIQNGIQTRKQDMKTAVSQIQIDQYIAKTTISGRAGTFGGNLTPAKFKENDTEISGNPCCEIEDGWIKIYKGGMYLLQAYGEFSLLEGYGNETDYHIGVVKDGEGTIRFTQTKQCTNLDGLSMMYVGNLKAGDRITLGYSGYANYNLKAIFTLNRLS